MLKGRRRSTAVPLLSGFVYWVTSGEFRLEVVLLLLFYLTEQNTLCEDFEMALVRSSTPETPTFTPLILKIFSLGKTLGLMYP